MKLKYILIIIPFLILMLSAQSSTEKAYTSDKQTISIDPIVLHGRWHLEEVILRLDDTNGLGANAEDAFKKSTESRRKVKQQIENGELAIITQYNHNGAYVHELVYSDPKLRFPFYSETGSWTFDGNTKQLIREPTDKELPTKKYRVMTINDDSLVLELRFTADEYDGLYKGVVETLRLKRFRETKQ